jgi:hypothetical protein
MDAKAWSRHVAEIAVNQLVRDGLCKPDDFERLTDVVAEEIFVRLCLGDTPPPVTQADIL